MMPQRTMRPSVARVSEQLVNTVNLWWWRGRAVNLCPINVVAVRRTRSVFEWVNVHISVRNQYPGQLSLATHPLIGAMSVSESWGVNRRTARCTRRARGLAV